MSVERSTEFYAEAAAAHIKDIKKEGHIERFETVADKRESVLRILDLTHPEDARRFREQYGS